MHISICDDEEIVCPQMEDFLNVFQHKYSITIEVDTFSSGEELLAASAAGNEYDVIFLDIEMAKINGVEVGKTIRAADDEQTVIIYISGNDGYALALFEIRPFDFLLKPINEEKLEEDLLKIIALKEKENRYFEYKNGKCLERVRYQDVLYFCSSGKKILIYKTDGTIDEFYGKMADVENKVPTLSFLKIHKSYLVNIDHIKHYEYQEIQLDNKTALIISQTHRKKVRDQLLKRG